MNLHEYHWVKQTRKILLDYCSELKPDEFTRQIHGIGWQSVRDTLVHIADCYHGWLGSFILLKTNNPVTPKQDLPNFGLHEIKLSFQQADSYVEQVLEKYDNMNELIDRKIPWRDSSSLSISPSKLLMHVITHEYHHKGQIVTMIRQLGYTPPNTDVLGLDD